MTMIEIGVIGFYSVRRGEKTKTGQIGVSVGGDVIRIDVERYEMKFPILLARPQAALLAELLTSAIETSRPGVPETVTVRDGMGLNAIRKLK